MLYVHQIDGTQHANRETPAGEGEGRRATRALALLFPLPSSLFPTPYSYCNAASTLRRAARRAGSIAATTPARIATARKASSVPIGSENETPISSLSAFVTSADR